MIGPAEHWNGQREVCPTTASNLRQKEYAQKCITGNCCDTELESTVCTFQCHRNVLCCPHGPLVMMHVCHSCDSCLFPAQAGRMRHRKNFRSVFYVLHRSGFSDASILRVSEGGNRYRDAAS